MAEKFWHSQSLKGSTSLPASPSAGRSPHVGAHYFTDSAEVRSQAGSVGPARSAAPTGFTSKTSVSSINIMSESVEESRRSRGCGDEGRECWSWFLNFLHMAVSVFAHSLPVPPPQSTRHLPPMILPIAPNVALLHFTTATAANRRHHRRISLTQYLKSRMEQLEVALQEERESRKKVSARTHMCAFVVT